MTETPTKTSYNSRLQELGTRVKHVVVPLGASTEIQKAADKVMDWSKDQRMHLNEDKCKEIRIDFKRTDTASIQF